MSRPKSKQIKNQLFLNCGRVDMYNMQKYAKEKLQLHHDPPYRITHHTIYEESFLLSDENHVELHKLELDNREEYENRMEVIRNNKKILAFKRSRH